MAQNLCLHAVSEQRMYLAANDNILFIKAQSLPRRTCDTEKERER